MAQASSDDAARSKSQTAMKAPHGLHPEDTAKFPRKRMEWLPDWRDPAAYPASGTSNAEWAWELLRRNRYFQRDCLAAESDSERAEVCQKWRLQSFKPFWEDYSVGRAGPPQSTESEKNLDDALLVTRTTFRSPSKLVLELNPEALADSAAARNRQFKLLRELIETNHLAHSPAATSAPRTSWTSKVGKYLRVADALSLRTPEDRKVIGDQLHREKLILVADEQPRSDEEVLAALRSHNALNRFDEELTNQRARRAHLARKYSREIGSQIARSYNLIYAEGYRLLLGSDAITTTTAGKYDKKRKPYISHWGSIFDDRPTANPPRPPHVADPATWD